MVLEAAAETAAAQSEWRWRRERTRTCPSISDARRRRSCAACLHDAAADEQPLRAELRIAHPLGVACKVVGVVEDIGGEFVVVRTEAAQDRRQRLDVARIELGDADGGPSLPGALVDREEFGGQLPDVLAGVIEIHNLDCAGEVLLGDPN